MNPMNGTGLNMSKNFNKMFSASPLAGGRQTGYLPSAAGATARILPRFKHLPYV